MSACEVTICSYIAAVIIFIARVFEFSPRYSANLAALLCPFYLVLCVLLTVIWTSPVYIVSLLRVVCGLCPVSCVLDALYILLCTLPCRLSVLCVHCDVM